MDIAGVHDRRRRPRSLDTVRELRRPPQENAVVLGTHD